MLLNVIVNVSLYNFYVGTTVVKMELKQSAFETVWIIDNYCNIKCFSMLLYVRSCMGKIACEEGLFIVMYSIEILTSVFKTINTLKSYKITILMMLK